MIRDWLPYVVGACAGLFMPLSWVLLGLLVYGFFLVMRAVAHIQHDRKIWKEFRQRHSQRGQQLWP